MRTLCALVAATLFGCTDPPPEVVPEWRWEPPEGMAVKSMKRLDDGGTILSLDGDGFTDVWTIVRLSEAGEVVWSVDLPWVDFQGAPRVDVSSDRTFVVAHPTAENACRVLRLDGDGQEVDAFDYPFGCAWLAGLPDGGFAIGDGRQFEIRNADGTARAAIALAACDDVRDGVGADDGVFVSGVALDCAEDGKPIWETGRPWNGRFDGETLVWTRASDEGQGAVSMPSNLTLTSERFLTIDAAENGDRSIHAFDRGNGQALWVDDGGGFVGIDSIDEDSVVLLWVWIDSYRLRKYDADGTLLEEWSIPLELSSVQRVAAAPDGSVLVAFGDPATTYAIERYQLP